jgi:hypothetical protein
MPTTDNVVHSPQYFSQLAPLVPKMTTLSLPSPPFILHNQRLCRGSVLGMFNSS